jgi:phage repressor protein C with HTH and peptisase S24 domain
MMLAQNNFWQPTDTVADNCVLNASGLAWKCGLDAATFNSSKRTSPGGRECWLFKETLSELLSLTGNWES